jgi:hypothetical protein
VLHEEKVTQMLEQVGYEASEILALLGELLDECQEPRRVAVDHQVADSEERLLLDRAEELEDSLDRDVPVRRRRELVERGNGVAEAAARAPRDE